MHCSNNIKQVALAVLNYESANKVFPAGVRSLPRIPAGGIAAFSDATGLSGPWSVVILPFIDDGARLRPVLARHRVRRYRGGGISQQQPAIRAQSQLSMSLRYLCLPDSDDVELHGRRRRRHRQPRPARTTRFGSAAASPVARPRDVQQRHDVCQLAIRTGLVSDGTSHVYLLAETKYQISQAGVLVFNQTYPGYAQEYYSWAGSLRAGNASADRCTSTTTIAHAVDAINYSYNDPSTTFMPEVVTRFAVIIPAVAMWQWSTVRRIF